MIQLLVAQQESGGVYDFSVRLRDAIGCDNAKVVHLFKENAVDWQYDKDDSIILQMSGYGFDNRGAPLWLLSEIERRRRSIRTFGVFFHELYALGPIWSPSFWLSPVQQFICRRLARKADFWMTNREGSARWLQQCAGGKPNSVLPVCSVVGESTAPNRERKARVIVFGSAELRLRTYRQAGTRFFDWAKGQALEIHDIGAEIRDLPFARVLERHRVVQHGYLDRSGIHDLFQSAMFGVVAYPVEYVAKSSVFAAYCAYGICPILVSRMHLQADGLVAGIHYLPKFPYSANCTSSEIVGRAAWDWYQAHNVASHADAIRALLAKANHS